MSITSMRLYLSYNHDNIGQLRKGFCLCRLFTCIWTILFGWMSHINVHYKHEITSVLQSWQYWSIKKGFLSMSVVYLHMDNSFRMNVTYKCINDHLALFVTSVETGVMLMFIGYCLSQSVIVVALQNTDLPIYFSAMKIKIHNKTRKCYILSGHKCKIQNNTKFHTIWEKGRDLTQSYDKSPDI